MWELVKRSLQRERAMTAAQLGRPRRASVQRMHNEIVEAFLKAGRQRVRRSATGRLASMDSVAGESTRAVRGVRGGIWRAVSSLGFAIAMAIRLLNPYVLISVALSQRQSLLAHLSARVDSMRAVLSPRIGRRRRLTAWVQDTLPQRHVPEAASAVWQDGSLLCGIVDAAVPGSCPGYDSLSPPNADRGATLWLGQKLAARYLGVPPAFSNDEFSIPHLTIHMERRMLRYLSALKAASARVEAERQRRQVALENCGGSAVEEDAFSLDTIGNSSLPPGESLLECVARGMGLILGVQGRKSTFFLYLNPNHPHRHVHRLMQNSSRSLERQPSFDDEAGTILMQIRGPEGDFGATLLSTSPGSSSTALGPSLDILNENWYGRIPISYETSEESVTVSYVPQTPGRHELILLQRGGSHVPGSPFSITVEESSEVPDDNGKRRRFGSEPVDGLLHPGPKPMAKATSYESGLDKGHRRLGSGGSDPGTKSEGDTPVGASGAGQKRRVIARVVDFVTEKMLLTEDGKLERLPKRRKIGREKRLNENRDLLSEEDEIREITNSRRYSTLYTSWGQMKHLEVDEPLHDTYHSRRSPVENGKSETTYGISKSGLELETDASEYSIKVSKGKRRGGEKLVKISDIASRSGKESLDSINFREHCRRILWLCDILLKHSPRQESLEILNTAGDILDGKRVHPTIMEESEPEDALNVTPPQSLTELPPFQSEARARTLPPASKSLAQRLQREPSDTGGLNEVSAWRDGRRQYHSWARKDREGGGTVGGRLIHKGGSYRGVVVRDMTPEALAGAYSGGDDLIEEEGSKKKVLEEDGDMLDEDYVFEGGRAASGMPRHSLPKIRPPSLGKRMICRGASMETLEQRTSASDRETDGSRATVSGKELNKSIAPNDKEQINYSDRDLRRADGGGKEKDREKEMKASKASGSGGCLKDHPRYHSDKEDKKGPSGVERKNIVLAVAVALAEEEIKETEAESCEEPLSSIVTAAILAKEEEQTGEDDKKLVDASSKGEPPPVQDIKGGEGKEQDGGVGKEGVAYGGVKDDEEEREKRLVPAVPAYEEVEAAPEAGEINEHPPSPTSGPPMRPPSPPIHPLDAGQSPGSQEGMALDRSDVAESVEPAGSGYPRTISEKEPEKGESEVIKETEEEEEDKEETKEEAEDVGEQVEDRNKVKGKAEELEREKKDDLEIKMDTKHEETTKEEPRGLTMEANEIVEKDAETGGGVKKEEDDTEHQESLCIKALDDRGGILENVKERDRKGVIELSKEKVSEKEIDDLERWEDRNSAVKEKKVEKWVEDIEESKENRNEISPENHKEVDKIKESVEEGAIEVWDEAGIIEYFVTVEGEKEQQQIGNEKGNARDGEEIIGDGKTEVVFENIDESSLINITKSCSRYETENMKEGTSEEEHQLVVITGETYTVKETVVGDEYQSLEPGQVTHEELCRTEVHLVPQINIIEWENKGREAVDKEKVDWVECIERENVTNADQKENKGRLNEEREKRDERIEYEEHNNIDEETVEKDERVTENDRQTYIITGDTGMILLDKEKEGKVDGNYKNEEEIVIPKNYYDDVEKSSEGQNEMAAMEVGEAEKSVIHGEHMHIKGEVMNEDRQDITSNLFQVEPDKNLVMGELHEVLKLEDAFFTSTMGIQNTKECRNAPIITDKKDHVSPEEEKVNESVPKENTERKENSDLGKVPLANEMEENEKEKMIEVTESTEDKSSEGKEKKDRIDNKEIKTKNEPGLEREELNHSKVDTTIIKEKPGNEVIVLGKNEELTGQSLLTKGQADFEDSNLLEEFSIRESCVDKEPRKRTDILTNETFADGSDENERERSCLWIEKFDLKENDAREETEGDIFKESSAEKTAFEADRKIAEDIKEKIVPPYEKEKDVRKENEMKENFQIDEVVEKEKNATPISSVTAEKLEDGLEEMVKIMPEKQVSAIDKCSSNTTEYGPKGGSKIKDGTCLKSDKFHAKEERELDEKKSEDGEYLPSREREMNEMEKTHTEDHVEEENEARELNENKPEKMGGKIISYNNDNLMFTEKKQSEKQNEKIKDEQILKEEISADEMKDNAQLKTLSGVKEMKIKIINYEEAALEKIENEKTSVPRVGEEYEDKIESRPLEEDVEKIDHIEDTTETKEFQAEAAQKKKLQQYGAPIEEENINEVVWEGERREKATEGIPVNIGEIKSQALELEKSTTSEKPQQEESVEQFRYIIEEVKPIKESTQLWKTNDEENTLEVESQVCRSQRTTPTVEENSFKLKESSYDTSLQINELKDSTDTNKFETMATRKLICSELGESENTLTKLKECDKTDEDVSLPYKNKSMIGDYAKDTSTVEESRMTNEPELGSPVGFVGDVEDKEREIYKKSTEYGAEALILDLERSEDGYMKDGAEREREIDDLMDSEEGKAKLDRGASGGETPEVVKSSKEDPSGTQPRKEEEKGVPSGADMKYPTYSEIIGRILCTDSFPSESLEWFEEEGKKGAGELVEGKMESMKEEYVEATAAGTAVGDEVWDVPEISEKEPFREIEGSGGPETHGKEGVVIGRTEEKQECEGMRQGDAEEDEEEGIDQWTTGLTSNLDDDEDVGFRQEGGGPSLRVGMGVVVAGGIVSRDSSRRDSTEGREAAWRRSKWRASRSKSIEEGLPLPEDDPVGREWEEICMGIDAMEDGSISQVIAEVSGKRRRRRTRKERGDRSGKAMRMGDGRWGRDGAERPLVEAASVGKELPIPESTMESIEAEKEAQQRTSAGIGQPLMKGGGKVTTADIVGEEDVEKGEREASEGTGASRDESPRVGMFGEPWWYSSSSRGSSLGGVKIEELRVDWVGAMEEGKRGRGPAEEEGIEAREDAREVGEKAKEGTNEKGSEREKGFSGDRAEVAISWTKMAQPEGSRIKDAGVKHLEGPFDTSSREIHLESNERAEGMDTNEKSKSEAIYERMCDEISETYPESEGLYETDLVKESERKEEEMKEKFEGSIEKGKKEDEKIEGEEQEEEDEEDEKEKVDKEIVPSYVEDQGLKETVKAELDETNLGNVFTTEESEKCRGDSERRGSKSMQPPGDDIFSELDNKHSPKEGESSFSHRFSSRGKLTEAQSSGEWEFVDTGGHFAGNENVERETLNEWEGQYPYGNYASDPKGLFLHPIIGNRDNSQSPSVVGMGIELFKSLVDIPKGEERTSTDGSSPKREGEELFVVQMTLDEWDRKKELDNIGPETEVVVGELDLLDDWEQGVGKIGFIEVTTNEYEEGHLKGRNEVGVEINRIEKDHEKLTGSSFDTDRKHAEIGNMDQKRKSSNVSTDDDISSEESESLKEQKEEEVELDDDDDIEEIVRTESDGWSAGSFAFMESDHRNAFRNLEDLLGGDVTFRMSACSAQFNLWPSEEAFGGKGTWTEHIDMDAFMSTAQSGQKSCTGKGLLEGMTTFARTYMAGDEKGSSTTREQYYFTRGEGSEEMKARHVDGEEEEIVLIEQDFDDQSDEMEDNMDPGAQWGSTYQSFDIGHQPRVGKNDAFAIYESPGVTTYNTQEDENMCTDVDVTEKTICRKNQSRVTLCDSDEMGMLELDGDWEEGIIFLDDDDDYKDISISGRRGSGEYRKFGGEVEGKLDADLWGAMPQTRDNSSTGDLAYAVVMDSEEMKEKTPVLPTGRWCPRLPLLSPAMSAISEEESEETCPEKEEKQDEDSACFKTENVWECGSTPDEQNVGKSEDEKILEDPFLWELASGDEKQRNNLEKFNDESASQPLTVTLLPDDSYITDSSIENLEESDTKHQLPKLDIEVEDGFGESFARRRSSTSSVVSDTTTAEPMADCGAAFVVSTELAVTLALGVSITQIIPPAIDLPEIPPLPQVEEATDALSIGNIDGEKKPENCIENDLQTRIAEYFEDTEEDDQQQGQYGRIGAVRIFDMPYVVDKNKKSQIFSIATDKQTENKFALKEIKPNVDIGAREKENLSPEYVGEKPISSVESTKSELNKTTGARKRITDVSVESKGQGKAENSKNRDVNNLWKEINEEDEKKSTGGTRKRGEKNDIGRKDGRNILFPESECNWYNDDDDEGIECWSSRGLNTKESAEKEKKIEHEKFEEDKAIVFEEKQKAPAKNKSAPSGGDVDEENKRFAEGKGKSSPPGGARKKESPDKKTRDGPPKPIPLEKLLGWPSENGNGNGLGCSGVASRRESVFDDYNFSLWENGFKLNRETDNQRSKRQDSTGLEYYLDVDQLLNVPLAATEPEVKYVSAKEIMDTFTRGDAMDSPEKISEKECEDKGEKVSKSDSLDDSEGASGGASIGFLGEGMIVGAAGYSSQRGDLTESKGPGADPWDDDLFAEFSQGSNIHAPKMGSKELPLIFTSQDDTKSYTLSDEGGRDNTLMNTIAEGVTFEKKEDSKLAKKLARGNQSGGNEKDFHISFGVEEKKRVKSSDSGNFRDQWQHEILSKKSNDSDVKTQREIPSSGGKVRNMLGIFERPGSTNTNKEMAPAKENKGEKCPLNIFEETKSTDDNKFEEGLPSASEVSNDRLEIQGLTIILSEATGETVKREDEVSPLTTSPLIVDSTGERDRGAEIISKAQEEGEAKRIPEGESTEFHLFQEEKIISMKEEQLTEVKPPTLEDKKDVILSLTEEPVVGWEAIKVATEVENIILSTGNGVEQKKNIMGEVVIGVEPDKPPGAIGERDKVRADDSESGSKRREMQGPSNSSRRLSGTEIKTEITKVGESGNVSTRIDDAWKSRKALLTTSSSFEEYKSIVSEAYHFLEALGGTVDEDEDVPPGEEAKETGGKAEESVGGLGSEVEVYHPCEELPGGGSETIPCGVEGAPTKGLVEPQSSPSSPERSKTTESSTSSSPYSSLPTFADISSGILSSASSKDENSLKTEDGPSRKERANKLESRGTPRAEAERTADVGSAISGDNLEEEIDCSTLSKMNVASRKEYWDRRLQRAQDKNKEPVTVGTKPPPLRFSGIVARGRMSFEKSKDEYSTSDSGGDGGKSSSESSPTSRVKPITYRPKAIYCKGTKSILPSRAEFKEQGVEKSIPREENETIRTLEEHSDGTKLKGDDDVLSREIATPTAEENIQQTKIIEDRGDLSQIPVSKRTEIWDQKLQKMSEDESPPSSLEYRRTERKTSSRVESTEALLTQSSTEDKNENRAPYIRAKGVVPRHRQELEELSVSIDSSSLDDKGVKGEGIKKGLPIKTTGSVSQLAKLFSSPPPEPSPPKYKRGCPAHKGKYSKELEKGNLTSKVESFEELSGKSEIPTSTISPTKTDISPSTTNIVGTASRASIRDDIFSEKTHSVEKDQENCEQDRRKSTSSFLKKSPLRVSDNNEFADNAKSEVDNLASRRHKYLESVQQSLESEENRNESTLKKSESEDSMKERMGRKGISDVRNIWEKRASLDGSSSSESMKKSGKVVSISSSSNSARKKFAQEKRQTTKARAGQFGKANEAQAQGGSPVRGTEGKRQVERLQEKPVEQDKESSSIATPRTPREKEQIDGETLPRTVVLQEARQEKEKANETLLPLPDKSAGRSVSGLSSEDTGELREAKPSSEEEGIQTITQMKCIRAQQTDSPSRVEEKMNFRDTSDRETNQGKAEGSSVQPENIASPGEWVAVENFLPPERTTTSQDPINTPATKAFPPEREMRAEGKREPSEATAPSPFKGRRHSCASVSPPRKVDLSKMKDKCGSVEEKMMEFQGPKFKRDSLEIRVTDDEDVCVMREVTCVPRFLPKEKKMETHEEEEDGKQAGAQKIVAEEDDNTLKTPSPTSAGAKRRSLPQRTLSIQVSGIVASGRRRFESGKAAAEDMPTLSEEIAETATKSPSSRDPPSARRALEDRTTPALAEGIEEEEEGEGNEERALRSAFRGGLLATAEREAALMEEGARPPRAPESGARELYRAVPVTVTVEGDQRGGGVRVEMKASSEETLTASKGEEGGDDGRSATSRRASKGKAPPKKQPPPSAASSPDSENEGAAESKLLGFLSTPAAQIRRHSAVDVATLRAFTTGEPTGGGPRLGRRGSGDLGSPSSQKKEDESKKRFTRARQFFETLEKGKDSPPSPPQSGAEDRAPSKADSIKKKKAKEKDERAPLGTSSLGRRTGATKYRPPVPSGAKGSSGSTTDSDKEKKHRRKVRRTPSEKTHSAPGSDVDSSGSAPITHPSLHRRKREKDFVLRSQRFGGSEREVRVSERFNVMDLFRDVAGPGTGVSSGRATPLGIPHQAAVLAALRSVEDVRSSETTSPYDMYRPVEADNDCEPKAAADPASATASATASGAEDEGEQAASSANDENANADEEGNVTFSSPMTLCVKKEYQAEYPHLPMTSPRDSRHRSSNTDLIPRNVLLQRDANQNTPKKPSSSRRSIAELF